MGVSFRYAERSDKGKLQNFTCAPPKPSYGQNDPAPYQREVQGHIRGLKIPTPPDEKVLLCEEDSDIIAVFHFGFDNTGELIILFALGVDVDKRRSGLARGMMERVLKECSDIKDSSQLNKLELIGRVAPDNLIMHVFLPKFGFIKDGKDNGYDLYRKFI